MTISFSTVWANVWEFAKKPSLEPLRESFKEYPQKIFPYLLGIDLVLMFALSILLSLAGAQDLDHEVEKLLDNPLLLATMAVFFAPLLEEAIFRLPIGAWLGKYFKLVYWSLTIGFALLHLTNFSVSFPLYLAPLLILPQFLLGIIIGFVRLGWGFWYGVLFHALHNGILVGLTFIGMALEPMVN